MRRGLARTLTVAALALLAAPAHALADESLQASGSITFTWQGSPTLGCGAIGVCDVRGALILELQGQADAQRFGSHTFLNLDQSAETTRVLTRTGECVDVPPQPGGGTVFVTRNARGRLAGSIQAPLSSGRCAGPLASELARVTLAVRRSAGKHPSYDLRTTRSFTAGPFAGRLVSTVTMRPSTASGFSSSSSGGSSGGPPPARKVLVEHVELRYRVSELPGSLVLSFAGQPDPFCAAVDSCGASGTVSLTPRHLSTTVTLSASRQVARPVDARRAIKDLRLGRMTLHGQLTAGLVASEAFVRADGSRCQDSTPSVGALFVGGFFGGSRGRGAFLAEEDGATDALRTHCPGPGFGDAFGSNGTFLMARGPLDVAQLLHRHSVLTVSNSGGFTGLGYSGSRSGAIAVSLTLERVRAGTTQELR